MSIISPEYAKELEDELKKAYEIRPDMFHKELIDGFADRILKCAEEQGYACIGLMNKLYTDKYEIDFTAEEFSAIKNMLTDHGLVIDEEHKRASKEELGDNYNPLRDDYLILCTNDMVFHFLKMNGSPGAFLEHAKNGIKATYTITEFRENSSHMFFNSPGLESLVYRDKDVEDFNELMDIFDTGLRTKQFKSLSGTDYDKERREIDAIRYDTLPRRRRRKRK